ncbi:MAG TPA: hypothetical protein VFP53_00400 [Sphingomicrobium sp.]|nr:hypothetical protein [Sphingomicrobium sp.]
MTAGAIVETAIGVALLVAGVIAYRRGGSQGAVLLFVVAALLLIHGLGLLDYRPSPSELGR